MNKKPRFKTTDVKTLIRALERKPAYYPTYSFSSRTFIKRDLPGRKP